MSWPRLTTSLIWTRLILTNGRNSCELEGSKMTSRGTSFCRIPVGREVINETCWVIIIIISSSSRWRQPIGIVEPREISEATSLRLAMTSSGPEVIDFIALDPMTSRSWPPVMLKIAVPVTVWQLRLVFFSILVSVQFSYKSVTSFQLTGLIFGWLI